MWVWCPKSISIWAVEVYRQLPVGLWGTISVLEHLHICWWTASRSIEFQNLLRVANWFHGRPVLHSWYWVSVHPDFSSANTNSVQADIQDSKIELFTFTVQTKCILTLYPNLYQLMMMLLIGPLDQWIIKIAHSKVVNIRLDTVIDISLEGSLYIH